MGGGNVELISLNPFDFDITKGKGYNELLLINQTLKQSKILKQSKYFFKVTGRYPILNLDYFIKEAEESLVHRNHDYYGDMQDYDLNDFAIFRLLHKKGVHHVGEARLFASKIDFYNTYIGSRYCELNDYNGSLVENLLYEVMKNSDNITRRFGREPHFGGYEGSMNDSFWFTRNQDSFKAKVKRLIGNTIRIFIPNFYQ